ncbi:FRG domain-containing protein [Acinetobacter schindleri]|nr:FRG domain-containing protein [Acinetobacter schindleri]
MQQSRLDVTVVAELETQPQHTIASVSQFIDKINELSTEDELKNRELFFRGHRDALRYFLQPSLFRQYKSKGYIYLKSEKSSFMDLLTTEPKSFSNESRCFDILTHMQHYSFPTRLLDISSNPLAALYFACEIEKDDKGKEKDIDGEVILFYIKKSEIKYFDSDAVSCVTNLAKLTESQKKELIKLIEQCESETPPRKAFKSTDYENNEAYASYIHFIRQEKPYFEPKIKISDLNKVLCVKGRLTQDRIIAQAGSFLLFGLDASLPEDGNDVFKIKRIRIKSANKSSILKELDQLKVNLRTIYPSLENTAKYIKSKLELEADSK